MRAAVVSRCGWAWPYACSCHAFALAHACVACVLPLRARADSHLCFEAALKLNPSDANAMLELKKTTNADWTRPAPVSSGSDRTPDRGGTPYDGLTGQPVTLTPAQLASLNAAQSTADRAADAAKLSRASVAAVRAAQRSNSMLPPEEHVEHEAPEDDVDALPGWE